MTLTGRERRERYLERKPLCSRCLVAPHVKHSSYCQTCLRSYQKEAYQKNPEKFKLRVKRYRQNNQEKIKAKRHRYRDRQRELRRLWALKNVYQITPEEYATLLETQAGLCAICKTGDAREAIDHDHETGKVRGLLCSKCNLGIGLFKEDPKLFQSAVDYLCR